MRNEPAVLPPVFHFTKKLLLFHADFQKAFMNGYDFAPITVGACLRACYLPWSLPHECESQRFSP